MAMNIIQDIRDEIENTYVEPTSRDLTLLAVVFLVALGLIGAYFLFWRGSSTGYYVIGAGVLLAVSRVFTAFFRRVYLAWVVFALVLGYFVSRVILTILFFGIVLPTGLLMRLFGKDPMDRKFDSAAPSYWIRRENQEEQTLERCEKQF
jgi:hypothetical protein